MDIKQLLKKHKAYAQLLSKLSPVTNNKLSLDLLEIAGMPFSLQQVLIKTLTEDLDTGIIYSARDSLEVRRYLQTAQLIDLKTTTRDELINLLGNYNLTRVPKVITTGEFAVTGDIITFWPFASNHPIRVSYFDQSYESASTYDEVYGRKYNDIQQLVLGDVRQLETAAVKENIYLSGHQQKVNATALIFGGDNLDNFDSKSQFEFDFSYPQLYFQRFDLLEREIAAKSDYEFYIQTAHEKELPANLKKLVIDSKQRLEAGLVSASLKTVVLTDRELFGTVFLNKEAKYLSSDKARKMLAELEGEIEIGDYVVHEDHGIGIYNGIKQEKYEQKIQLGFAEYKTNIIYEDYIQVLYGDGDELYVPLSQINKITKYIASDDNEPKLTRLGKNEWTTYKKKVKASIERYAKELVALYAKREMANAPKIDVEDTAGFNKFLEKFVYTETPDQLRTEKEIYEDLRQTKPMNRLIVGDVGYGKTEVAMRAAYKVLESGYQVAVLCPTTVLAAQHEKVFSDRFADAKFRVAGLSRFSKSTNKQTVRDMAEGKVDMIIGTHRLLTPDIDFKKLGLIIIDEEQKFGVKQKEKLKQLEYGVHVLTMSATPIPRTLSMALSTIQDISLIQTPPEGRKGIKTFVQKMDWQKINDAITTEVERGGQVYFVHNRVQTIQSTLLKLQKLSPGIRFAVAHGQMSSESLQEVISRFYNKDSDVLLCTTIIENGIDMPNVNTIIIEKAQNFGLGQLYQLRGRVGRSKKQAYAYLFYEGENLENPEEPLKYSNHAVEEGKIKVSPKIYKKRLKAILEASELGAGFKLASRDLEIRGAGNLLGKEQHGNINYIGYGLYMQLLAQEIERLTSLANYKEPAINA